ncbi:hypothetical protein J3459_021554 [Metarhizium acridum]|nr:hypothetical protein J3459_021554 [Metarhizium acridum]
MLNPGTNMTPLPLFYLFTCPPHHYRHLCFVAAGSLSCSFRIYTLYNAQMLKPDQVQTLGSNEKSIIDILKCLSISCNHIPGLVFLFLQPRIHTRQTDLLDFMLAVS